MTGLTWEYVEEAADLNEINKVEDILGVKFPEDFIQCAIINHGAMPTLNTFDFEGYKGASVGELLSFNSSSSIYVLNIFNDIRDRLSDRVIPIANDPGGNFICFDYRKKFVPTVVYWDHERAFENPNQSVTYICETFTEFLNKLYIIE